MKKLFQLVILGLVIVLAFAGCAKAPVESVATPAEIPAADGLDFTKYKLAASIPLTGNNMQYGISYKNALTMAVDEFNAAGGLNGTEVELVIYDDKSDQTEAITVANKIIEDPKIFAVVGSFGSAVSMAAAPVYQEAKLPMISPNSSHVDFPGMGNYLLPISPISTVEMAACGEMLNKKFGTVDLAILHQNTDLGVSAAGILTENWEKLGGKVAMIENFVPAETKDFTPTLSKIKAAGIKLCHVTGTYSDIASILLQADQLGMDEVQFVSSGEVLLDEFLNLVGNKADGLIVCATTPVYNPTVTTRDVYGDTIVNFMENYNKRYGPDSSADGFSASAFDSANIVMRAAQNVGTASPDALMTEMETMKFDCVSGVNLRYVNGNTVLKSAMTYTVLDGKFASYSAE